MNTQKYVTYIRVSSKGQEQNTSLQNQKKIVDDFVNQRGGVIIETISEIVSGAKTLRKGILQAIELCKKENAILLVSKIDRLSRESTLLTRLAEEKVKFICANMPEANELVIGILVVIANYEKKLINDRTKEGRKATIEKYGKLHHIKGSNWCELTNEQRAKGQLTIKENALFNPRNQTSKAFAKSLFKNGTKPSQILIELNKHSFKTSKGLQFTQIIQVQRLLRA